MASFSIVGSGSIISLIIPRLSQTPELQPLFQLSVADLLLATCWLIGAILYSQRCDHLSALCYNLHTVEQVTAAPPLWGSLTGFLGKFEGFP
ncbi:PREDICTED: transmembrane protein 116-like [Poecilia mexicana]|uniref:transmembrane protein 116-like n=1 Tax=Poecilia mexicana TaxID=48701 RepID=UPI00072DFB7B|nr:PREDICTED: transmembrane protein 116-like [Poecilia mexicana]